MLAWDYTISDLPTGEPVRAPVRLPALAVQRPLIRFPVVPSLMIGIFTYLRPWQVAQLSDASSFVRPCD